MIQRCKGQRLAGVLPREYGLESKRAAALRATQKFYTSPARNCKCKVLSDPVN